jgi:hypothetical protein
VNVTRGFRAITAAVAVVALGVALAVQGGAPALASSAFDFTVTLTNTSGAPLSGAAVFAYQIANGSEVAGDPAPKAAAVANKPGTYVFSGTAQLQAGPQYTLGFLIGGGSASSYSQLLGGVATFPQAETFTVGTAPGAVTALTTSLETSGAITGTVYGPSGKPLAGVSVHGFVFDGASWSDQVQVATNAAGQYTMNELVPGSYKLEFYAANGAYQTVFAGEASSLGAATPTSVGLTGTTVVNASFSAYSGSIIGVAESEVSEWGDIAPMVGATPAAYRITAVSQLGYPLGADLDHPILGTKSSATGAWSITGLAPGQYAVQLMPRYAYQRAGFVGVGQTLGTTSVWHVRAGAIDTGDTNFGLVGKAGSFTISAHDINNNWPAGLQVELRSEASPIKDFVGVTNSQGVASLGMSGATPILAAGPYRLTVIDPSGKYEPTNTEYNILAGPNIYGLYLSLVYAHPGFTVAPTIAQTSTEVGTIYAVTATSSRPTATLSYQWLRDGHPIYGAVSSSYQSRLADVGSLLSVRVAESSFGFATVFGYATVAGVTVETSTQPLVVALPQISPSSDDAIHSGTVLHVSSGTWDTTGLAFGYQWFEDGVEIVGATNGGLQVTSDDIGHEFSATVTAARQGDIDSAPAATSNSVAPTYGPATTPRVAPTVVASTIGVPTGTTRYTVNPGQWAGLDPTFSYTWRLGATVVGGNSAVYTSVDTASTLAEILTVEVDAAVAGFDPGSATATARKATVALTATSQPYATYVDNDSAVHTATSDSTIEVGEPLTIHPGTWTPLTSDDQLSFTYQWRRASEWALPAAIPGATSATYTPTPADIGSRLSFVEVASSRDWKSSTSNAIAVGDVGLDTALSQSSPTVTIPIDNPAGVAIKPAVSAGWPNAHLSYQWYVCALPSCSPTAASSLFTPVAGATSALYTPPGGLSNSRVFVLVTAHRFGFADATVRSNVAGVTGGVLSILGMPTVYTSTTSTVHVGLSVNFNVWAPIVGGPAPAKSLVWQVCSASCASPAAVWVTADGTVGTGYTPSFVPDAVDYGNGTSYLRVLEVATESGYASAYSPSAMQQIVLGSMPMATAPTLKHDTVSGTWSVTLGAAAPSAGVAVQTVQWYVGSQAEPTNDTNSYTPTPDDAGQALFATDTITAPGYQPYVDLLRAIVGTDAGLAVSPNSIVGDTFGQTITLATAVPWDLPGAGTPAWTISYTWFDATTNASSYGTSTPYFVPAASLIGHSFKVYVGASSSIYPSLSQLVGTFILQPGDPIEATTPAEVVAPESVVSGSTLSATVPTYSIPGVTPSTVWQVSRDDTHWTTIAGALGSSYVVTPTDQGDWIRTEVTGSEAGYPSSVSDSEPVQVELGDAIRELSEPLLTGDAAVGGALTVDPGAWPTGVTTSVQWLLDGNPIPGATSYQYAPPATAYGDEVSVLVTASAPGVPDYVVESNRMTIGLGLAAHANVAPTITGVGTLAAPLAVTTGAWSVTGLVFTYQWSDQSGAIVGATANSLVLPAGDVRANISVTVTATRYGYADGSAVAH